MQSLARTSSKGTAYTQAQVLAQLFGPATAEQWVFDWLGPDGRYKGDLTKYLDDALVPRITHDSTSFVKRALSFNVRSPGAALAINPLQDLVRVHYLLYMPDGGTLDFVVGTFALMPPKKDIKIKALNQTFQAADLSQLLVDGAFTNTYTVLAGNTIGTASGNILNSLGGLYPFQFIIPDTGVKLAKDLVWEAGVSRLQALNDVMEAFNYTPVWFDELGILRTFPIPDWAQLPPAYTFDLVNTPAGKTPIAEEKDLSKSFNQCLVIVERQSPTPATFFGFAQNTNPLSEVSIPRWHPKMGPVIRDSKINDQTTATARAQTEIAQAARVYNPVTLNTLAWPVSQNLDVYGLLYNTADEGVQFNKFLEIGWTMDCVPGGATLHKLQKVFPTQ